MTHRHGKPEQRDKYGRTAAEGAKWRENQDLIVIPRNTETPEERLARLDDFPEEQRDILRREAERAIARRDGPSR